MSDNQNLVFSGFFNSYDNNDRLYNAEHFNKFFDGIISDGVYVNYPADEDDPTEKAFYVKPGTGLQVTVAKGRAWLLNTYTYTESSLLFTLDPTTISAYSRIDAIVIDVNKGDEVRMNDIIVVKGTEASTPDRPALIEQPNHTQFPIAFVTIPGGATSLSQSNIAYTVGTDDEDAIPAVEALLEIASKSKKELQDQINAIKAPTFIEAETVANINSGDNINTIWGKIKKMFSTIIAGLPISMGGTGATTAADALTNLGIPQNVADAMSKQIYCSQDENKSIVDLAHGGTGSNDGTINGVRVMKSGSTYGYVKEGETNITPFRNPTGNAAAGDVLSGKTFANASSDAVTGTFASQEKTVTGSRSAQTVTPDSGKWLSKVTVNKYPDANGTYTASSRGASLDMGASNNYRYVNTNSVPNTNSGTYTFPANDTGGTKDLGATNTYRYVNAGNVYSKGSSDGYSSGRTQGRADQAAHAAYMAVYQAGYPDGKDWLGGKAIFQIADLGLTITLRWGETTSNYTLRAEMGFAFFHSYNTCHT